LLRGALISLALIVVGPLLTRFGIVRFPAGLGMTALGVLGAAAVLVLAIVAALRGGGIAALPAAAVAIAALVVPVSQLALAGRPPAIHDISTDTEDPPAFAAVLPLRGTDASTPDYDGPEAAAAQRRAYPDVVPVSLSLAPADALSRAGRAAEALGWTIVANDPARGVLEATATTFWFRFTDDIVIRVRPDGSGSRLDIRSKSRVGRGDLGANARRIRAFVTELQRVS
jgi:uncharacterized protein (DUF1499 family)